MHLLTSFDRQGRADREILGSGPLPGQSCEEEGKAIQHRFHADKCCNSCGEAALGESVVEGENDQKATSWILTSELRRTVC